MKKLKMILIFLVTSYTLSLALLFLLQERLIFHPSKLQAGYKYDFNEATEGWLKISHKTQLNYLYFTVNKPKLQMVYFHGNAGSLESWGHVAQELSQKLRANVLIYDYQGYGKSEGNIPWSKKEFISNGIEVVQLARSLNTQNLPLYLYGRSLGSGIASEVAHVLKTLNVSLGGLVLETPYFSLAHRATEIATFAPKSLVRYNFQNSKAESTTILNNVLLLHGTSDQVIPYSHSLKLKKAFSEAYFLKTFKGGNHHNLASFPDYWSAVQRYINL